MEVGKDEEEGNMKEYKGNEKGRCAMEEGGSKGR